MSQSVAIPLVAAGAVSALAVLALAVLALRDPEGSKRKVEALFRRPPRPPRKPGPDHYYRPYWS